MNFTWCGQSCGSTSRAFIHEKIYDAVIERIKARIAHFKPGIPTDAATTMGAIASKAQFDRVMSFIESAKTKVLELIAGGGPPSDPALAKALCRADSFRRDGKKTIAREEIFGPVLGVFKWSDEADMLLQVNQVEYGLTASIWTNDLNTAHRTAMAVEAGYVWINEVGKHFLGAPFGGIQTIGLRPRGMLRGDALLHAGEEHPLEVEAGQVLDRIEAAGGPNLAGIGRNQELDEIGRRAGNLSHCGDAGAVSDGGPPKTETPIVMPALAGRVIEPCPLKSV